MSANPKRVTLTPVHLVRLGSGLDAVRVQARGHGLLLGTFGLLRVRGSVDRCLLRRFRSPRCRALFVGVHGLSWASVPLAPAGVISVPVPGHLSTPDLPCPPSPPDLIVDLCVTPPEPP